ncbi:hypothetical protein B0H13DRAFT_2377900 [Mycena leptocephala]|nr:hypothetical protein B0H13DRAFT_2377900 [Mycena leptocephala]
MDDSLDSSASLQLVIVTVPAFRLAQSLSPALSSENSRPWRLSTSVPPCVSRSPPAWNSGRDNFRAVSQAGCDIKFIAQGRRYDVFQNVESYNNLCPRTSIPAASASSPRRTLSSSPSAPSSTSTSNSSCIHARFDYLTALTSLSHWPPPPLLWIYLAASRSRIIHRGMAARIPALFRPAGAYTTLELSRWASSARLPFAFARKPLFGAGYTPHSLPLRLRQGALAVKCAQDALILLMRDWERCETRSRPELSCGRYPPELAHLAHYLVDLVHLSTETEPAGNGNADEDGVSVSMETASSAVWYPLFLPTPSLSSSLWPSSPARLPLTPAVWYGTRWRRAAAIEECGYGCGCGCPHEHILSLIVLLRIAPSRAHFSSLDAYRYVRAVELDKGAGSAIQAGCPYVSPPASLSSSYADTESARSADLLCLDAHWRIAEVGMEMENSRGCACTFCPPLPRTRSYLAIFLSKLSRIPVFSTI